MKKTFLIGLVAVALGSMTACTNILEEEGTISASAKTGKLTIGLETDGSVNVVTKTTENVDFSSINVNDFTISVTATTTIPTTTLPNTIGTHTVPVGTYNLSATYGTMSADLEWNKPCFLGTNNGVQVVANGVPASGTITCELTNSIIDILEDSYTNLTSKNIGVNFIAVVRSSATISKDTDIASLNPCYFYHKDSQTSLRSEFLYAKSELTDVKVVIDGYLTQQTGKTFRAYADIKTDNSIGAKNKYNVSFSLNEDNGSLTLGITINGTVTKQPITVPVNPYE